MTEYPIVKVEQDTRLLSDEELETVTGGSLGSASAEIVKAIGGALSTVARAS
jgi:hypothetical protein